MKFVAALAAVCALSICDAYNTMCLNGNTHIKKLYVDGVDYTNRLPRRANAFQCDCIHIPPFASTIAVKAAVSHLQLNKPGIQECETDVHANFKEWICAPSSRVRGKWYEKNYPIGNRIWQSPVTSGCQRSCRRQDVLPCNTKKCFWTFQRAPSVNCIKKKCADGCNGCLSSGPGKCDPGMCKYGESVDQLRGVTACNRVCKLEVKAWNVTGSGHVKLTDNPTGRVTKYNLNNPGVYLTTVDMSMCTLTTVYYHAWVNEQVHSDLLRDWVGKSSTELKNIVGVEVGVGFDPDPYSYPQFIGVYNLGIGSGNYLGAVAPEFYAGYSGTLTGVNNGVVQLTDHVLTPPSG